jgi:hypothetical protein
MAADVYPQGTAEVADCAPAVPRRRLAECPSASSNGARSLPYFDLSDIAVAVRNIERLPREDDGEEEAHEG